MRAPRCHCRSVRGRMMRLPPLRGRDPVVGSGWKGVAYRVGELLDRIIDRRLTRAVIAPPPLDTRGGEEGQPSSTRARALSATLPGFLG